MTITATPGAKMNYLIKRRAGTTREELVAHWFANHMPLVIDGQQAQKAKGRLHAWRYIATLFQAGKDGHHAWDGIAQLYWDRALPTPDKPFGDPPGDMFQVKAEPYYPWATTEYVVLDGKLSEEANTLNAPYPATRGGLHKVTFLVKARPDSNFDDFFEHWLEVHAPNVMSALQQSGGHRYVISHSIEPETAPYAGMAELYFDAENGWRDYLANIEPDGMEQWAQDEGTLVLKSDTEMVGIP